MKTNVRDILIRFLPVINAVMLFVLFYLAYSFIYKDTGYEYSANSKSPSFDSYSAIDQNSTDTVNTDIILERDIFNSSKVASSQEQNPAQTNLTPTKTVAKKQLELRLLGTVAGSGDVACAIIEDMKSKVQDLYKTGDTVQGAVIEKIERNRIILRNEGAQEILNLYVAGQNNTDTVAAANVTAVTKPEENSTGDIIKIISPNEREVNKNAFLAKIGGIEAILKTVKINAHKTDGVEDGLQISGLEGLSMATFVGLKNGDIIQTINGQAVANERKAFQVLRKARSLNSFDLELKRGTENKTLSFKID